MTTTIKDVHNAFERFCEVYNIPTSRLTNEPYFLHLNYNKVTNQYQLNYISVDKHYHSNHGIGTIFANKSYKAKELVNQLYALIDAFYYLKSLEK